MSGAWARIGVKCVCVDAKSVARPGHFLNLVVGKTYEIERVGIYPSWPAPGAPCVWLKGEPNLGDQYGAFLLSRFRPLITQADDVALFASHLIREVADA